MLSKSSAIFFQYSQMGSEIDQIIQIRAESNKETRGSWTIYEVENEKSNITKLKAFT